MRTIHLENVSCPAHFLQKFHGIVTVTKIIIQQEECVFFSTFFEEIDFPNFEEIEIRVTSLYTTNPELRCTWIWIPSETSNWSKDLHFLMAQFPKLKKVEKIFN